MAPNVWDVLRDVGVVHDSGSDRILPYRAATHYNGHPVTIRFGAFLSWPSPFSDSHAVDALAQQLLRLTGGELTGIDLVEIDHQAGGHGCTQYSFIARPVRIADAMVPFTTDLCAHFYHAYGGWFWEGSEPSREAVDAYRSRCRSAGLSLYDSSPHYRQPVMEAIYPIAGSDRNIRRFVGDHDRVMRELAPLLTCKLLRDELFILVLAENSD